MRDTGREMRDKDREIRGLERVILNTLNIVLEQYSTADNISFYFYCTVRTT